MPQKQDFIIEDKMKYGYQTTMKWIGIRKIIVPLMWRVLR